MNEWAFTQLFELEHKQWWYRYVESKDNSDLVSVCRELQLEGTKAKGRDLHSQRVSEGWHEKTWFGQEPVEYVDSRSIMLDWTHEVDWLRHRAAFKTEDGHEWTKVQKFQRWYQR